ncbi:hypothetical protein GCM10007972_04930 [Iodidimonas muriae]|uniref:DUF1353 domain-containing protein n=1 Tax=Iodidimonas muriae TaxID=261467 RepID=A0ABQ2L890_9PROT|nr:DUF1353 domain-containing protein [Iodidimonas muriae]GER05708.1 hypothetical protein JCM17843_00180 [Kordiimonadales bacterium JCM 17843]GGO06514.1 hypothetical protein GCM10007972_04930 [Iodidimonas muriae]
MSVDTPRYVTPIIADPYPNGPWQEITNFRYLTPLHLYRARRGIPFGTAMRGADYVVAQPYRIAIDIDGITKNITVPAGMLTDLASVPSFARAVAGRVGRHLEASIVHDFLYIAWQDLPNRSPEKRDRKYADLILDQGMKAAQSRVRMPIFRAVRLFGWGVYKKPDNPRYIDTDDIEPGPAII